MAPDTFTFEPDQESRTVHRDRIGELREERLQGLQTVREFIALTGRVLGNARKPLRLPAFSVQVGALFDKRLKGSAEMDHQRTAPWVVDHSAFEATFGPFAVTPHEQAVEETARWYRR